MADAATKKAVQDRWPDLAFLLRVPELDRLFTRAITENLTPGAFQSQLRATQWFRSQPASSRQWMVTINTDPGEARLQRQNTSFELDAIARKTWGTALTPAQLKWLTETALVRGLEVNSPEMLNAIRKVAKPGAGRGEIGVYAAQIRELGTGQWFVVPGKDSTYKVASQIILGQDTIESANARFAAEAKKRYPHLAQRIDGGETLADITEGYRTIVAEELELGDIDRVDIVKNPTWRQLLGTRDPKTKEMRMPTESEVVRMARSQNAWGDTAKAREMQYGIVRGLGEMFGERKF